MKFVRRAGAPGHSGARDYPPLAVAAAIALGLLVLLPSSLNLPQTNPAETLEYAPVPPEDNEADPPPAGNLSSLGLGASGSLREAGAESEESSIDPADLSGRSLKAPSTKRCVGNPPRQTEDPLSPPCVGTFNGDNGGATYRGVTGDEVDILLYVVGGGWRYDVGSRGVILRPEAAYFDAAEPRTAENENYFVDVARTWQRYFNERYQTYGRFVHFHVYFSGGDETPESRRADAADNFHKIKPFAAIIWDHPVGVIEPYIETMARYGVLNFGSISQRPAELFSKFPKLVWGFEPSIEQAVHQFATYVCNKVVPHPVAFGRDEDRGKPRKLGMILTDDTYYPNKTRFGVLARDAIKRCGGDFVAEAHFPWNAANADSGETYAQTQMAEFENAGVTTIIWGQGYEFNYTRAAKLLDYTPEWIVAGDGENDDIASGKQQDPDVWSHARIVSTATLTGTIPEELCYQAAREANPELTFHDAPKSCQLYNHFRQLFVGIQVAGPRLNPATIDKGFRAIPAKPSTHPSQPSCYYEPDDYTCVKDTIPMWWDSTAENRYSSTTGCWKVPEGGRRYRAADWPREPVDARRSAGDSCTGYTTGRVFDPYPGPESPPAQ